MDLTEILTKIETHGQSLNSKLKEIRTLTDTYRGFQAKLKAHIETELKEYISKKPQIHCDDASVSIVENDYKVEEISICLGDPFEDHGPNSDLTERCSDFVSNYAPLKFV